MKKCLFFATLCLIFWTSPAIAGELDCSSHFGKAFLNKCQDHTVDTHRENKKFGQVIEGKIPLWKAEKFDINSKTGLDHANGDAYTIVQVDVKLEEGIVQTAWRKTFGKLFGGRE